MVNIRGCSPFQVLSCSSPLLRIPPRSIDGEEVELILSGKGLRAIRSRRAEKIDRLREEDETPDASEEIPPLSPDIPPSDSIVPSMPEPEGAMRTRLDPDA